MQSVPHPSPLPLGERDGVRGHVMPEVSWRNYAVHKRIERVNEEG
jgi:hypothetical protein